MRGDSRVCVVGAETADVGRIYARLAAHNGPAAEKEDSILKYQYIDCALASGRVLCSWDPRCWQRARTNAAVTERWRALWGSSASFDSD